MNDNSSISQDNNVISNKYTIIKLLGEGSYGKAYLVNDIITKSFLVVKSIIIPTTMPEKDRNNALQESKILEQLNHPSIIKFIEVIIEKPNIIPPITTLHIVMDYADGGDLLQRIKKQNGKLFPEETIINWFTQICLAIKHIHDRKILHRDIKSQNIFMTKKGNVQLGDFGIAKCLDQTLDKAKTIVGTPYYLSPEIINNEPYDFKSDIWSLGVLLYEMCTLTVPFTAQNFPQLIVKIIKGVYAPIASLYSKELMGLIKTMLTANKNQRPNINQILRHSIIKGKIKNFLNEQEYQREFSHTLLHKYNILDEKKGEEGVRQSINHTLSKNNKHRSTEKQLRYDQRNETYEIDKDDYDSNSNKRRPTEINSNINKSQQQNNNMLRSKNNSYRNIHDSKNSSNSKKKDMKENKNLYANEGKHQYIPQSHKELIYKRKTPASSHSKNKYVSDFNILPKHSHKQSQNEIKQHYDDDDLFSFQFDDKSSINQPYNDDIKQSSHIDTQIDSFPNNQNDKSDLKKEKKNDNNNNQKKNLILEEFMKNKHEKIKHSLIISDNLWFKNNNDNSKNNLPSSSFENIILKSTEAVKHKDNDQIQSQQMLYELENLHSEDYNLSNSRKEPYDYDEDNNCNIIINNNTHNDTSVIYPLYNIMTEDEDDKVKEEVIQCDLDILPSAKAYDYFNEDEASVKNNEDKCIDNVYDCSITTDDNTTQPKIRDSISIEIKNELGLEFYTKLYSFIMKNVTDDIIEYDIDQLNNKIQMAFTEIPKLIMKKALLYIPDIYFLILTSGDD